MSGYSTRLSNLKPIKIPTEPTAQSFCSCDFRCGFVEYAFSGSDDYDSDKSSFIFKKIGSSDTVDLYIYKDGVLKATISNNTYGTYYSFFTNQLNYVGFIADWALIYTAFGQGYYTVNADLSILGSSYSIESRQFNVMPFDEKIASTTVKIESYQSGNIIGNDFDYTDLINGGWYDSIRLPVVPNGFKLNSEKQEDRYFDSSYNLIQNLETAKRLYEINFKQIPDSVHHRLISTEQLSNYMRISNYDLFSDQEYRNIEVIVESVGSSERNFYGRQNFSMTFKDRKEDLRKRNV